MRGGWTLSAGSTVTLDDLAAHCRREGLARPKHPEQLEVVDSLPRNAMDTIQTGAHRSFCLMVTGGPRCVCVRDCGRG